jgi:hypothetical protein
MKNEDYTFYDFFQKNKSRIPDNHISISWHKRTYYLLISINISKEIRESGLDKLRVRVDNITNDIHLLFNNEVGLPVNLEGEIAIRINNLDLVKLIYNHFSIKEKHVRLPISNNLSNNPSKYLTYKINLK